MTLPETLCRILAVASMVAAALAIGVSFIALEVNERGGRSNNPALARHLSWWLLAIATVVWLAAIVTWAWTHHILDGRHPGLFALDFTFMGVYDVGGTAALARGWLDLLMFGVTVMVVPTAVAFNAKWLD